MQKVKVGNLDLEVFDSIEDLPMNRYHLFNRYLLIESGIGSDLSALDAHFEKVGKYLQLDQKDNALAEMTNLRNCVFMIQEQLKPDMMAYATLIYSINGKLVTDLSEQGLKDIKAQIEHASKNTLLRLFLGLKKKSKMNLRSIFRRLLKKG